MPGQSIVYGAILADTVRTGQVPEPVLDEMVRRTPRLAAHGRTGALRGVAPVVPESDLPARIDGAALAREVAVRGMVLLRNQDDLLPLSPGISRIALIGAVVARSPRRDRGAARRLTSYGARHRTTSAMSGRCRQHSMTFTASPPRAVSLYFTFISAPVSRIVLMT